ncbi:MAG: hypothetical protein KBT06_02115 [Prevotellaceae bacterium]|nr:hypothetical protein [Candidatus Colivivens equi]
MIDISQKTIIVCGIVRNAEKGLKKNIPIINSFCNQFQDFNIFIYENDSTDATKVLLKEWKSSNPEKIFISLNTTNSAHAIPTKNPNNGANKFYCHERINKMAHLRNQYMIYIDEQKWKSDYIMVVDLDVALLKLEGLLSSFETNISWDAVCANGYSLSPRLTRRYHDTYALVPSGEDNIPQTEKSITKLSYQLGKLKRDMPWIKISSGFGGVAIYRFEAIAGLRYAEPSLPNDDMRVEVRCEHFSIYQQMKNKGFNNFYLNPSMELLYQKVSAKIIWNSIKRKFRIN